MIGRMKLRFLGAIIGLAIAAIAGFLYWRKKRQSWSKH
ncbi:MAG TPA: hypothetical protein DCY61_05340 [Dehalococcoidia bacterium]|nr:hypothetical protein [Dehalococcoidia bacterium]